VGLTTAALASVTLLSQSAGAAPSAPSEPKQSIEEVRQQVDELYRQAGTATQQYNQAKERTDTQRETADALLDEVADRTENLNEARRTLGRYAAAQYRSGGVSPTATLLLADDPQGYFDQSRLMDRMTSRQRQAVADYQGRHQAAADKRVEATESLATLTASQQKLQATKKSVQDKLSEARELLSTLTAEEKARLAEIERRQEEEAQRKAAELARQQEQQRLEEQALLEQQAQTADSGSTDTGSGTADTTGTTSTADTGSTADTYATKAAKAIAFARDQIGKPYVWGATGPNSYDCSGLTQAAWKAAGVSLPRTTWDQVEVGTRVATEDLQPGDLVFFYDDISHEGLYIGDGQMIHAPKPGTNVRIESIYYMPIYGGVRPA
jgi:cell wall-associated NlpC family hydrolase